MAFIFPRFMDDYYFFGDATSYLLLIWMSLGYHFAIVSL
jgi:hypothetical protein